MHVPRGFSTIEILLALTIMSTTLTAIVLVELGMPRVLADGVKELAATRAASNLLEGSLEKGLSDPDNLTSSASTTANGITVSLTITTLPDGITKYLLSDAAWIDNEGRSRFMTLHAFLTDFSHVTENSPCSDVLEGDWTNPQERTSTLASGDLLPNGSVSVHPISTMTVSSSTLLTGLGTSVAKTDPTLFMFDISSTTNPVYLGNIDTATSTKQGVSAVSTSGSYVYVANASKSNFETCTRSAACSQMQIFDISIPTTPRDVEDFQLSTTSEPFATGSGGQAIGRSIAYQNGYIYLGLTKTGNSAGEEFNIIDVHNPRSPLWLGGFPIGRSVNRIIVHGSYAYLATDDPARELIVLDIHDPTNITLVGTYDAPGTSTFGYGNDLTLKGTMLALGRTYTPNGPELSLLSVASSTPQVLSSEAIATILNPVSVKAVLARSFLLFVLTNTSLLTFDLHDPTKPIQYAPPLNLPLGSTGSALTCRDNTLYVASIGIDQSGYLTTVTGS